MQLGHSIGRDYSDDRVSIIRSKHGRLLTCESVYPYLHRVFSLLVWPRFSDSYTRLALLFLFLACVASSPTFAYGYNSDLVSFNNSEEPIQPLPQAPSINPVIVALGEKLFFEKQLSRDNNTSCADCHRLDHGGADTRSVSPMGSGKQTRFNTPSIFNVKFNGSYYWNAELTSLEKELSRSIINLNSDWNTIQARLNRIAEYKELFEKNFSDGLTVENIQLCLLSFEKSLITPNSRFDRYLNGNRNALSKAEIQGYLLFKNYGCVACHQGINIGGNLSIGAKDTAYTPLAKTVALENPKRLKISHKRIRVPSLRNVSKTAPYFHNGSVSNLIQAVKIEARVNANANLTDSESMLIVEFLNSLTGQYQGQPL